MNITKEREKRGWSKAELARKIQAIAGGDHKSWCISLVKYEGGDTVPRPETLEVIRRAFGDVTQDEIKASCASALKFMLRAHEPAVLAKALRSLANDIAR